MLDLGSRLILLAGAITIGARSLYFVWRVNTTARRIALLSMVPACVAWIVFELTTITSVQEFADELTTPVWWSRLALFLTLVSWFVIQWIITLTEKTRARNGR